MNLDIEKFNPTRAELISLVEKSKAITLPDPHDDMQLAIVKSTRGELRSTRTAIAKRGKELRDDALAFQRAVIKTERDLVAIIEPEEDRLAALIDDAVQKRERLARRDVLPHRMERLATIGDDIIVTEDEILDLDGPAFEGYYNKRQSDQNERIRIANEQKERELRAEAERLRHEQEDREREERARMEERETIRMEQLAKEERQAQEKAREEKKAEEDRRKQEQDARFQAFLQEHGYTAENARDFLLNHSDHEVVLYKKVAVFKKSTESA